MAYSLKICGTVAITIEREKMYSVPYKSVVLPNKFFADFVVFDQVILEIKAKDSIVPEDIAQTLKGSQITAPGRVRKTPQRFGKRRPG